MEMKFGDKTQGETKSEEKEKNSCEVGGELAENGDLEKLVEVEKSGNSNEKFKKNDLKVKVTTEERVLEMARRLQRNDGNQGSKKDDTLTSKTTSDTEGGFIVEVNVPKTPVDCIELK